MNAHIATATLSGNQGTTGRRASIYSGPGITRYRVRLYREDRTLHKAVHRLTKAGAKRTARRWVTR